MESTDNKVIRRDAFPGHLDFTELRKTGIEHLGKLAGKIWTDHNVHDPGITILEMLCYALIDLGYRTNLPITDLLARKSGDTSTEDNFYTPSQILTMNPVTLLDYRKLLIDTPGVRNAWLEIHEDQVLYLNPFRVTDNVTFHLLSCDPDPENQHMDLRLRGLYDVYLELEREPDECKSKRKPEETQAILNAVCEKLHAHRNLGEDFERIHILCEQEIAFCGRITLHPSADPNQVNLEIFKAIEQFLSPSLRFYSLEEMLDRGTPMEEVFAGRPLLESSFGFLDSGEVESAGRIKEIRLSDLYGLIGNVKGVSSVRELRLLADGQPAGNPDACDYWIYRLPKDTVPVFCAPKTCFEFSSDGALRLEADRQKVLALFQQAYRVRRKALTPDDLDKAIPSGYYRKDLSEYYSIQHEFPRTYGIGEGGLPSDAPVERKAQALQMKGYLVFFDQLLANFMSQLSHLRELFSMRPDSLRPEAAQHTYFGAELDSVPDIQKLIRFYTNDFTEQNGWTEGTTVALPVASDGSSGEMVVSAQFVALTYPTFTERNMVIRQLIREFRQNDFTIEVSPDECGYTFELVTNVDGVRLASKRTYKSESAARLAGKTIAFLASLKSAYHLVNQYEVPEFSFELHFQQVDYLTYLSAIQEDRDLYARRRKQFLDHLLDRFAESFTDYSLLAYDHIMDSPIDRLLKENECKARFLSALPSINRNRARAFDYSEPGWHSENISGLEKRVMALACLGEGKRRTLCKFEVHQYDDKYTYTLHDEQANPLLISSVEYSSAAEAKAAYVSLIENIVHPENYRALDRAGQYGIQLVHPRGQAVFHQQYDQAEERDRVLQQIKGIFGSKEESNVFVSSFISRLVLERADGTRMKESRKQYESPQAAKADIPYFLKNINKQLWLTGESERPKFSLDATTLDASYLDVRGIPEDRIATESLYRWQVSASGDKPWMESEAAYSDEQEAREALIRFLSGSARSCRADIETRNDEMTVVLLEQDQVIARGKCRDQKEAEERKKELTEFLAGDHPGQPWIRKRKNVYSWQVHSPEGIFMKSSQLFTDRRQAEVAADRVRETLEAGKGRIRKTESENYLWELSDKGKVAGTSVDTYLSEEQAREAMDRLLENREARQIITEREENAWQCCLPGEKDSPVLESYLCYRNMQEALVALDELVAMSGRKERYHRTGDEPHLDYSFVLRAADGRYLAIHPNEYALPEDRDKELTRISERLKDCHMPMHIRTEYRGIFMEEKEPLLVSMKAYAGKKAAHNEMVRCLVCAVDSQNYEERPMPGGYSRELLVKNDQQEVVARYPKDYVGRHISIRVIRQVKDVLLPHLYRIAPSEHPDQWKYQYGLTEEAEPVRMLESMESFTSREEAIAAFDQFSQTMGQLTVSEEDDHLLVSDKAGDVLAVSNPEAQVTKEKVMEYMDRSVQYQRILARAPQDDAAIEKIPGRKGGNYVFRVVDRDHYPAYHPCHCQPKEDPQLADRLWTRAVKGYNFLEICLGGDICIEENGRHYFVIRDRSTNEVYLRSFQSYSSCEEAEEAFLDAYLWIIDKASDPDNYGSYGDVPPPAILTEPPPPEKECQATCQPDPAPLAVMSPEAREKYTIDELADLMCSYPIRIRVTVIGECPEEETVCYYFHLLNPDREKGDDCKEDWISTECFETIGEARSAFREFFILLRYRGNYHFHLDEDRCCYQLVIREVLLEGKQGYASEEEAWQALESMLRLTCDRDNYLVQWDETKCAFTLCILENGYRIACHHELFYDREAAENILERIQKALSDYETVQLHIQVDEADTGYAFAILHDDNQVLWRSYGSFLTREEARNTAWEVIARGRENDFYGQHENTPVILARNTKFIPHGMSFDLSDILAVRGDKEKLEADQLIPIMRRYPVDKEGDRYRLNFYQPHGEQPESFLSASFRIEREEDIAGRLEEFQAVLEGGTLEILEKEKCGRYEICLTDPSKEIARHPADYTHSSQVEEAIQRIMECTHQDGMHLIEHILLRPEERSETCCLFPAWPDKECAVDLPVPEDPCATNEVDSPEQYIPMADPFSFWVTVVLPGWTKRFCDLEKRIAFQQLIRKEAPAHLGINIHWLSPHDMCTVEEKYRRWLRWKGCQTICVDDDSPCRLIESLGGLTNMPPCPQEDQDQGCECDLPNEIPTTDIVINYLFHRVPDQVYGADFLRKIGVQGTQSFARPARMLTLAREHREDFFRYRTEFLNISPAASSVKEEIKRKKSSRSAKLEPLSEEEIINQVRHRMTAYRDEVEGLAGARFGDREEYQRAHLFLGGTAPHDQYRSLMGVLAAAYERARSEESLDLWRRIMANVTWYYLDQHLSNDHKKLPDEMAEILPGILSELDKPSRKAIRDGWDPADWSTWFDSRAVKKVNELLKK